MGSREPKHLSCPTHGAVWGTIYADGAVDYDCGCHATPTPPAPADDASGAEAWARLFHDTYERLAPSFGYETRKETRRFDPSSPNGRLMIAVCAALPLPGATPDATRVPATDDAVEEAMAPGCHEHVALWDAINAYSVACGGHPTRGGGARMDAVARVEKALRAALRREKESRSDDSRPASGQGGDK